MAFKDMREYLALLEKDGQLKHVDVPFKARRGDNELQALMSYICSKDGPALMLNNVDGINTQGVPILFNPFGTRERTAMTIGFRNWVAAELFSTAGFSCSRGGEKLAGVGNFSVRNPHADNGGRGKTTERARGKFIFHLRMKPRRLQP